MIKPNQTSANVNVISDEQLTQVTGGHGGCHKRRKYNHCYYKRDYDYGCNKDYGYESKSYDSDYDYDYEYNDCHKDSYDYCEKKYS